MEYTGERMILEHDRHDDLYVHHVARYGFSSQFVKNRVVLDIACGSGYGAKILLDSGAKKVVGIDISEEAIAYCRDHYPNEGLEFVCGSVDSIPLADGSVDVIVSFETIEHVNGETQNKFLEESVRVLKKGGLFIASTPNSSVSPKGNPFHVKELTYDEFLSLLSQKFSFVSMFFQDNVESSYVLSKSQLRESSFPSEKLICEKTGSVDEKDNLFFIAVCGDKELGCDTNGIMCVSDVRPWKRYVSYEERLRLQRDTAIFLDKNIDLEAKIGDLIREKTLLLEENLSMKKKFKELELDFMRKDFDLKKVIEMVTIMKRSRLWKLRELCMKWKTKIF